MKNQEGQAAGKMDEAVKVVKGKGEAQTDSILETLAAKLPQDLLLQYKYLDAVKRVTRGVAHNYNNIFTGLGGQTALLQQEMVMAGDTSVKRSELIGDLLKRGIEQTAILSGFARGIETESRRYSPLGPATKAVELLNCISRIHRFQLVSSVRQERFVCALQDIVLLLFYLGENCVDATPDGGDIVLEISAQKEGEKETAASLIFSFRDKGPGFSETFLASLSRPFITSKKDSPYSGLGLYAAGLLAQRHDGRLAVSRSGADVTVVSAVFPVASEEARPDINADKSEKQRPRPDELSKQCFLVVEDDEAMRTMLLNRLQRRGHMVFCVDTCSEALEEYSQLYDIITTVLMDVGLKDTSGYECYRKMLAVNPRMRIIFMSGQEGTISAGMSGKTVFLQKPFTLDQLETAVRHVHD